jgi:STE24 endopeptidase
MLAVALAALAVAALAVLVLSPGQPGPEAAAVDERAYFEPAEIERARDYRAQTRLLGLTVVALGLGVLALYALGRPRRLRVVLERLERRPLLGGAAAGALLSISVALVTLPVGFWLHELAVDVGISVQSSFDWLYDRVRAVGIGALYAAAGGALLLFLQRRLPRAWWLAGAGAVVAFAATVSFLAPVLLAPIFNDFEPLPPGQQRSDVVELADLAGVEIDQVYRVDASRRRTSLNAYVDGLGSTRRVVVYDTLLDSAERPALRSVVAHELAHVKFSDIPRGILFVAIVAPLGMLFVREAGGALAARRGFEPGEVRALPAYALALSAAAFVLGIAGNQLSLAVEERADRYALELTGDPDGLIELQTELARRNLSDPDPPAWASALLSTHPSTVERLGLAEAYGAEPPARGR